MILYSSPSVPSPVKMLANRSRMLFTVVIESILLMRRRVLMAGNPRRLLFSPRITKMTSWLDRLCLWRIVPPLGVADLLVLGGTWRDLDIGSSPASGTLTQILLSPSVKFELDVSAGYSQCGIPANLTLFTNRPKEHVVSMAIFQLCSSNCFREALCDPFCCI